MAQYATALVSHGTIHYNGSLVVAFTFEIVFLTKKHIHFYIYSMYIFIIVQKGVFIPLFLDHPPPFCLSPSFFQNCAIPPDKQYLFFKNFAFHSSIDAVQNVTVKEILISVSLTIFTKSSCRCSGAFSYYVRT